LVFGILVAFISNTILASVLPEESAWRWMLGVEGFPAAIYTMMAFGLPESPRWSILNGSYESAEVVMLQADPDLTVEEVRETIEDIADVAKNSASAGRFFTWRLKVPICLAFCCACLNQLSGINAVLYFAKRIFESAGLAEEAAMIQGIGIGLTNVVGTFVGLWLIDRSGRRSLMLAGSIGHVMSLSLISIGYYYEISYLVVAMVFVFIFFFAVGQGTVLWVFLAEIFPSAQRGQGQAFGSLVHWVVAALITQYFPPLTERLSNWMVFAGFAGFMFIQLLFVIFIMPETKGLTLEAVQVELGIASRSFVGSRIYTKDEVQLTTP